MKTAYERWIEANHNLNKCFESVSNDQYSTLSKLEQDSLCHSERQEVANFLTTNQITFANLLKERLEIVNHAQH
ncbi:UNKNOWN [Stylonychia lemnae]|uniref:Uncharacterized protein n=1 Tax=Stylonychia lemnae TaxID=5949 RepID=A0A078BBA7_STYLE|nr:UNKNOWN [Stylonychia lemnae]|eukprot:CDW91674.1 UNKNOWN [Stylonychia lemnae]